MNTLQKIGSRVERLKFLIHDLKLIPLNLN
jgi:hypothetical protein